MGLVENKYKKVKPIKQEHKNGCWAACLEWYMRAVKPSAAIAQKVLRQQSDIKKMYESDSTTGEVFNKKHADYGILEKHELMEVLRQPRWELTVWEMPVLQSSTIEDLLDSRGPIIIGYFDSYSNGNHINVICGFNADYSMAAAMEPRTGKFVERGLTTYTSDSPTNIVAWSKNDI